MDGLNALLSIRIVFPKGSTTPVAVALLLAITAGSNNDVILYRLDVSSREDIIPSWMPKSPPVAAKKDQASARGKLMTV